MSRADFDAQLDDLQTRLVAEQQRLQARLDTWGDWTGEAPRLDAERLGPAQDLARKIREVKAERAARARAVPKSLRQQVKQHKACLRNCEATIAALERRGLPATHQRARLAQHRARIAAAERAVDDAMGPPSPR